MVLIRRASITGAVAALTLAIAAPTAAAPPGSAPAGDVALTGSVQRNGRAAVADVVVVAWPNQDYLAALQDGESAPLVAVAAVRTKGSGRFSVSVDPAALPPDYVGRDGQVDLEVTAADSRSQMTWNVSVRSDRTPSGSRGWNAAKNAPAPEGIALSGTVGSSVPAPPSLDFDLGSGLVLDSTTPPDSAIDLRGAPITEAVDRASRTTAVTARQPSFDSTVESGAIALEAGAVVPMEPICSETARGYIYGVTEYFTHVQGASFANVKVTQGFESSHTLGIATQINTAGTWAASGSRTIKLESSGTSPTYTDARLMANKVNYRQYQNTCTGRLSARPAGYHTILSSQTYTTRRTYSYACQTYAKGQTFTKTQGTNTTIGGGVKFPYVSLNAQSGWNTKSSATWTWTGSGKLCADSSVGTATASGVGTMY